MEYAQDVLIACMRRAIDNYQHMSLAMRYGRIRRIPDEVLEGYASACDDDERAMRDHREFRYDELRGLSSSLCELSTANRCLLSEIYKRRIRLNETGDR